MGTAVTAVLTATAIPAPSKPAHRLDPAKDFLHPLADFQADLITPLRRGAPVQSGHPHVCFARHVRGNPRSRQPCTNPCW